MKEPIKVCIVSPNAYGFFVDEPRSIPGGAERQMANLSESLSKMDHLNVSLLVANFGQNKRIHHEKLQIVSSFSYEDSEVVKMFKMMKGLKEVNADIYIFRSVHLGIAFSIYFVKKILRKKTIYMVANKDESDPGLMHLLTGKFGAFAMNWVYKSVDLLVVQTKEQVDNFKLKRNILPGLKLPNLFNYSREILKKNFSKPYVIWVGRCDGLKQCEFYLDVVEQFKEIQFVMICPKSNDESLFKRISERAGLNSNLEFHTRLTAEEVVKYYQRATLYMITSKTEGFPNTMLEAMAYGCPVLSLNINPDQILDNFKCGECFENNEINSLINRMRVLITDKKCLEIYSENAIKYVQDNHLAENSAKMMNEKVLSIID